MKKNIYSQRIFVISWDDFPRVSGTNKSPYRANIILEPAKKNRHVGRPYDACTIGNNEPSTNKLANIIAMANAKQVARI